MQTPTTTAQTLDAILELLSEQAERERRAATDAGDAEGAALCRNHARAYAKARFHYGQRSDALGLCWHQALYIAAERLPAALGEARDADAEIDDDPELAGLLAAPAPLDGDWYAAEHAATPAA